MGRFYNWTMHIHILGICGTFMGGLAALAREAGHRVTGCDAGVYPPMSDQLRALGIELIEGYDTDQLALKPDVFVIGNVVSRARLPNGQARYPLMEAILDAGLPYISGPQWLADHVLQARHVLAVAGTHGKTTTTAMLTHILHQAGLQPGFLVGGVPLDFGVSARLGQRTSAHPRPLFVIEADEYDTAFFDKRSKFVHYRPRTAILNNLEYDHADIFENLAAIERQFHHLIRSVPAQGRLVVNRDGQALQRVLAMGSWSDVAEFGASPDSPWQVHGSEQHFSVQHQGRALGEIRWTLSGQHNQLNALAAVIAAEHVGVQPAQACEALSQFKNVKRRMEVVARIGSGSKAITLYDDFAHHPTAIQTTLEGLRRQVGSAARILAVFEPRSNTMKLGTMRDQLPSSLASADLVFCFSGGLDWDAAQSLTPLGERASTHDQIPQLVQAIASAAQPGDHIVCMSNGGFGGIHQQLAQALGQHAPSPL
ncbi:MAG: UDP-N-acetylmuramate:L-alanyl-gamma-D-glutamyl-meso-diaminopimelate ligase [Pseudomonadota bacterium]|jgi:UDP-N-acetylmuramate: L-alanyl-gamma-D-glutamyl-meso-diaminopimelate ligase